MIYWFSPSENAFYPEDLKDVYISAGSLPSDLNEVEKSVFLEFTSEPPEMKIRGVNDSGFPCWVDIPLPTQDELVAAAAEEKQRRIYETNEYINSKQWPGKAALGRLKGDDLTQYNAWLDYLDALDAVHTSTAPNVIWPEPPVV